MIVVAGAIPAQQLNGVVRGLQERNVHIQLSSGLRGIDFRRLRANPIAYEPLFYLEAPVLARRQIALKRVIDLLLGVLGLIIASPIFLLTWILIKIEDRGPLFFKQVRIGRHGRPFTVYKFRTMVVDAEARLKELEAGNERRGPLFKMTRDPRITRVGKFLRDSSLDELPQLINVVRGEMSLVGPRPALPAEVAQFDPELRDRPEGEAGPHGPVAGRGPGQPLVRRLPPARPLLRRELVRVARPHHPAGHGRARHRPPGFVGVRAPLTQARREGNGGGGAARAAPPPPYSRLRYRPVAGRERHTLRPGHRADGPPTARRTRRRATGTAPGHPRRPAGADAAAPCTDHASRPPPRGTRCRATQDATRGGLGTRRGEPADRLPSRA